MKTLHVSKTLSLPLELAARTQCIIAQKGAGKTYTGMKQTEEMLAAGLQVVCLDPTGVWWGLRSSADGKGDGYPILVMGGDHADLPLEPDAGEIVADFVVESGRSVILDMSAFESNRAQDRFAEEFAERIYRRKASDRAAIHLMIDEADSFAPQRPQPGQQRMLGAFEAIVRRGRSRGMGLTMITQRPAVLNKNVMSQADLIVCLRVVGLHDTKALEELFNLNATKEQREAFMTTLPTLTNGEAWFWSPGWLGIFQIAQIAKRKTFDSSKTPEPGQTAVVPKKLAPVDLEKLSDEIKASVEQATANDPAVLKKQVTHLHQEIAALKKVAEKSKPMLTDEDRKLLTDARLWMGDGFAKRLEGISNNIQRTIEAALFEVRKIAVVVEKTSHSQPVAVARPAPLPRTGAPAKSAPSAGGGNPSTPSGGIQRIMIALAQRPGISDKQVGIRAGLSSSSGTFGTYLGKLRSAGWLVGTRQSMRLTPAGIEALGNDYTPLPTGEGLYHHWLGELGQSGAARMLRVLYENYPTAMPKERIGELAGISSTSGTFGTYMGKLRSLELVSGSREIKASAEFFE